MEKSASSVIFHGEYIIERTHTHARTDARTHACARAHTTNTKLANKYSLKWKSKHNQINYKTKREILVTF